MHGQPHHVYPYARLYVCSCYIQAFLRHLHTKKRIKLKGEKESQGNREKDQKKQRERGSTACNCPVLPCPVCFAESKFMFANLTSIRQGQSQPSPSLSSSSWSIVKENIKSGVGLLLLFLLLFFRAIGSIFSSGHGCIRA